MLMRIILILLVLNLVLTSGSIFLSYNLWQSSSFGGGLLAGGSAQKEPAEEQKEYVFFPVEKIIVSLADAGREHYFVLDLVLQAELETDVEALKQIDPMVRNSVVSRLSRLAFAELRGMAISDVQATLDEALREDFNRKNIAVPFASVLVSKLIVQ